MIVRQWVQRLKSSNSKARRLYYAIYYQWLPIAAPLAIIILTGVGMELREQREKLRLMDLFSKYVGIHTGMVIAGSMGGARRMNYSVLEDVINIAARLEALNKDVVTDNLYRLLITEETLSCLGDRYTVKPAGTIQLRGRKQPTTFFTIMGEKIKARS
ncbi:adenylate/guanylate cyclase domain-containing protein [Leptolyngbyaceae cyanobacterium UHCC 1019]